MIGFAQLLLIVVGGMGLTLVIASIVNDLIQNRHDAVLDKRIEQEWVRSQHPSVISKWGEPRG